MKIITTKRLGYTLVELLVAITISLILLLGVMELFRHVGTSITDTQSTINVAQNLQNTSLQLQTDLKGINTSVNFPFTLATSPTPIDEDILGYFEIVEGMGAPYSDTIVDGVHIPHDKIFKGDQGTNADWTVGDVDDILMFTTQCPDTAYPFRGLYNGNVIDTQFAEVIWFVRGKTLYRRLLLVDDQNIAGDAISYENSDISLRWDSEQHRPVPNSLATLARRENRFAHSNRGPLSGTFPFDFPYPLYYDYNPDSNQPNLKSWYYLRMPTLEETVSSAWKAAEPLPIPAMSVPSPGTDPYYDLWDAPYHFKGTGNVDATIDQHTGSLMAYVSTPRHYRAGEDVILTNVISFDVKVWNPYWVPLVDGTWAPPQYIDLGQDRLLDVNGNLVKVNYNNNLSSPPTGVTTGFGFTLKGRYNTSTSERATANADSNNLERLVWVGDDSTTPGSLHENQFWQGPPMPCVYDSWSLSYEGSDSSDPTILGPKGPNYNQRNHQTWRCPPPYSEKLKGIQVTIRCYDPASGNIRQVRIAHEF